MLGAMGSFALVKRLTFAECVKVAIGTETYVESVSLTHKPKGYLAQAAMEFLTGLYYFSFTWLRVPSKYFFADEFTYAAESQWMRVEFVVGQTFASGEMASLPQRLKVVPTQL